MRVANYEIIEEGDIVKVSADVDGFRLWYRVPKSYTISRTGDAFLVSALLPAMRQGEKLEIDQSLTVSPKLLKNISLLQEIFHSWNPQKLKIIPISASMAPTESLNSGAMSFFSGGVDSMYTFLKNSDEITHAVFMNGFDFYGKNGGDSTFSVTDIRDLAYFAHRLMLPWNNFYAFIKGSLSNKTLQALSNYQNSGTDPGVLEENLAEDLNKIITGQSIYNARLFNGIKLRPKTRELLGQNLQREDILHLNRLLLEDACPQEIVRDQGGAFQSAVERNSRFVQSFGKTLIPVEHNHYAFGFRYNLCGSLTQGSVLASVGLLLGFPRVYVPSSVFYRELFLMGSHPLTDPLWSNESVEIIHDGCEAKRTDKLRKICEHKSALANLRVCWKDMNTNCGKCLKCLRTMIPLKLLGVSAIPFPSLPPVKTFQKSLANNNVEMIFFNENIELSLQSGDKELRNALYACMRKQEKKRLLVEFDRVLLNGVLKKTFRKIIHADKENRRIDADPWKE